MICATRALLSGPLTDGTEPGFPGFDNTAPFYLNETFSDYWYRIPTSYSLLDLLVDIGDMFLRYPQSLRANVDGAFFPLNIYDSRCDAASDIGCLGLILATAATPDEAEPVVQAAANLLDQLFSPLSQSIDCIIADCGTVNSEAYTVEEGDTDGASTVALPTFVIRIRRVMFQPDSRLGTRLRSGLL